MFDALPPSAPLPGISPAVLAQRKTDTNLVFDVQTGRGQTFAVTLDIAEAACARLVGAAAGWSHGTTCEVRRVLNAPALARSRGFHQERTRLSRASLARNPCVFLWWVRKGAPWWLLGVSKSWR